MTRITPKIGLMLLVILGLTACASKKPYRTHVEPVNCDQAFDDCGASIIENYSNYDLTFIEFTERGNFTSRRNSQRVLNFIKDQTSLSGKANQSGAAVVVFVHGWKHNAKASDENVIEFKEMLSQFSNNKVFGERRVIGLYVGWRGLSVSLPWFRELTFWERKDVAEEIGAGGVTEVLTRLNQALITKPMEKDLILRSDDLTAPRQVDRNALLIIGHSFGGAIVMSALHDVYLNNILAAQPKVNIKSYPVNCNKVEKFADGVVLLNPAIEANRGFQLKEAVSECNFGRQPKLMHVISSDGDSATKTFFPIGQWLNVTISRDQEDLDLDVRGKQIDISENELDINTIGNLQHFRTGYLKSAEGGESWVYRRCNNDSEEGLKDCGITSKRALKNHFPYVASSPLSFIKTDAHFIKNHTDIFNCKVQSYLTTIMHETQAVDHGAQYETIFPKKKYSENRSQRLAGCGINNFNFGQCFNSQLRDFCKSNEADISLNN